MPAPPGELEVKASLCHIDLSVRSGTDEAAIAKAERQLQSATNKWGPNALDIVPAINRLAELQRNRGEFEQSQALYHRAIDIVTAVGTDYQQELATLYGNLGVAYRHAGRYSEAEAALHRALDLRRRAYPPGDPHLALPNANLGALLVTQGRFDEARSSLDVALASLKDADALKSLRIDVLVGFATLYRASADYRQAELFFQQALTIQKSSGADDTVRMRLLNGLGSLYLLLGDFAAAQRTLAEAARLADPADSPPILAETYNNLAVLHQRQARYELAETCQQAAIAELQASYGPNHPLALTARHNLGMLYYRRGDFDQAEEALRDVLARRGQETPPPVLADNLNALAGVRWARGDGREAHDLLVQVLDLRLRALPPQHPDLATAYTNLAIEAAGSGRNSDSLEAFSRAVAIDTGLLEHVLGFTTEERKLLYLSEKSRHLYALFSLVSDRFPTDAGAVRLAADTWLQRKGMSLEAHRRYREALVYRDAPEAVALLLRLGQLRSELSRLVFSDNVRHPRAEQRQAMTRLESEIGSIEAELTRISHSYAEERHLARADVDQIVRRLSPDTILVEFARFDRFAFAQRDPRRRWQPAEYLAFLFSPLFDNGVKLVTLGPAAPIDDALFELRGHLGSSDAMMKQHSRLLYQTLFLPLEQHFPAGTREVLLAPDGLLNLIPFEILLNQDGRFLAEAYVFAYLPTGRDLLRRRVMPVPDSPVFLLGDPDFDLSPEDKRQILRSLELSAPDSGSRDRTSRLLGHSQPFFYPLPGTWREVEQIRQLLGSAPVDYYVKSRALEDLFYAFHGPRLMHLATHGFFLSNLTLPGEDATVRAGDGPPPVNNLLLRSGLALAGANRSLGELVSGHDGILTAEEVLGLDLRGTELVVLSACETGLGKVVDGEGVYGLRRSFAAAGAAGLIMSLWKVPDQETEELMVDFYRQMLLEGLSPSHALNRARTRLIATLRERYDYPSPALWGAFIYQGLPRPVASAH